MAEVGWGDQDSLIMRTMMGILWVWVSRNSLSQDPEVRGRDSGLRRKSEFN